MSVARQPDIPPGSEEKPEARGRSPLARITSASVIFDSLREAIVAMESPPGAPLVEKSLTLRFGVSRTPVREALIRLAEIGLVDIFPQSGTFVSRIPVAAIPEALAIRQALERLTVERAAAAATAADIDKLDEIVARQRFFAARRDLRSFHEVDEAFHEAIAVIAACPGAWRILKQVKVQIDRARRLTLPAPGRMNKVIGEHLIIRSAIAEHDQASARAAMSEHLNAVILDVDRLRRQNPDFFV
ncbi:MAG TPA: GntR family transcriptional regulator [Roseiarcus sp.]|nr:GntR family transcriptional regulator [Roseiarcus sp.]